MIHAAALYTAFMLFGTLGKNYQVTSKLRFTDVHLCEKDIERYKNNPKNIYHDLTAFYSMGMMGIGKEQEIQRAENYLIY